VLALVKHPEFFFLYQPFVFLRNLLSKIENLHLLTTLTELDLYDNQITKIEGLEALINLTTLDLSFNRISKLEVRYTRSSLCS
jgi:Leucine-rich repeat (LRR) protein